MPFDLDAPDPERFRAAPPDPLDAWPAFVGAVRARLDAGRRAYGDAGFTRPPGELLGELQQEALDLAGWGFVLWERIEGTRRNVAAAERGDAERALSPRAAAHGGAGSENVSGGLVGAPGPSADSSISAEAESGDAWAIPSEVASIVEQMGHAMGATPGAVIVLAVRTLANELERRAGARATSRIIVPGRDKP